MLDQLVDHLLDISGVHGARLTGGAGGCVVALTDPPGALQPALLLNRCMVCARGGSCDGPNPICRPGRTSDELLQQLCFLCLGNSDSEKDSALA